jgi:hypothetical protein
MEFDLFPHHTVIARRSQLFAVVPFSANEFSFNPLSMHTFLTLSSMKWNFSLSISSA